MVDALSDEELRLRFEVEDFLYYEADLLDDHLYDEWLDLFTDDARYWMPMRRNVPSRDMSAEMTVENRDMSWFDNDKETLEKRVKQIKTGVHWADEPLSRVSHMVSNVRLLSSDSSQVGPGEVRAKCRFLFYRNRHIDEESTFVGKRIDTLRRVDGRLKIARREIYLDQNVLLYKNLTSFF